MIRKSPSENPTFEVSIEHKSGLIVSQVLLDNDVHASLLFAFYLLRDGEVIWRGGYSTNASAEFLPQSPGVHKVKAFVKGGDFKASKFSLPINVEVDSVKKFDASAEKLPPNLPFTALELPHRDFAVFSISNDVEERLPSALEQLAEMTNLSPVSWPTEHGKLNAIAKPDAYVEDGRAIFSGSTRLDDRLILGPGELGQGDIHNIGDGVGDFSRGVFKPSGFEIDSDFFGVGKIFYYQSERIVCASNRYHLMLTVLNTIGEPLELDSIKARGSLQAVNQPFTQNFSEEMDVRGCKMLRVGKKMRIRGMALSFHDTEIAEVVSQPTDQHLTSNEYWSRVNDAADEIVDNLRVAVTHRQSDAVRVDLTGGMDARLVIAALSKLPEYRDRVHIHTADVAGSPHDLRISLALTRMIGLEYDTLTRTTHSMVASESLKESLSYNLGSYFGVRPETSRSRLGRTLRINGFYGEVSARPYFARSVFGTPAASLSPADFACDYIDSVPERDRPTGRNDELSAMFRTEFDALPGESSAARLDAFYLFYRNGLHCSDRWLSRALAPAWGPLQSKKLFALRWATFDTFANIKLQMDVTECLNQEVALLPIGREKDNRDRAAIDERYTVDWQNVDAQLDLTSSDFERYSEANAVRANRLVREPRTDVHRVSIMNDLFDAQYESWLLEAVDYLSTETDIVSPREAVVLGDKIGEWGAKNERPPQRLIVLGNKLLSLYFQAKLVAS